MKSTASKGWAGIGRRGNKYHAVRTVVNGITFDSKHEAADYIKLVARERAGEISNLRVHIPYELIVNGIKIGKYTPDFVYWDVLLEREVVADSKGVATRDYVLRKKLMLALYGIEILELHARPKKPRKKKVVKDGE